ncbi:hypothetical protein Tco_1565027 [Tanacetum coccineum]
MSSVVQSSLKKETSTLGEIVSLNYIKSNKNVIGLTKSNYAQSPREAKPGPFRSPYASLKAKGYKYPFTTLGEGCRFSLLRGVTVALLEKKDRSEGFHQIVDFLNASHIRFALSENPTIYDSHIKQFLQTATVNTLDNREQEITATINGHVKTVTIASVRKYLQLADAGGLNSLPNTKFFDQLLLMGYAITSDKLTFQKGHFPLTGS